jgi:hypothetical protein
MIRDSKRLPIEVTVNNGVITGNVSASLGLIIT